ncbi:UNVERIFIED_CONTAM: hypothetical protein GTU68_061843 [Idotea baltica]|nr:hypothetical protein [Idotea baltica]
MIQVDPELTVTLANRITDLVQNIKRCAVCNNLSDDDLCSICSSTHRSDQVLCIVETFRDVIAIEETGQFSGKYHVLGGVISPIDGIGPGDLFLDRLWARLKEHEVKEVILAINPTMDGDTTNFYLYRKLNDLEINVSVIARGVAFGGELEYADGVTLGHSISARRPYQIQE